MPWGWAQTFGAVALGLARYREALQVTEVIANRVASDRHAALLAQGLPASLLLLGAILAMKP